MSEKEKILSKLNIRDYRNELEYVLEEKFFDEEAKSLLLSVFYKYDTFYKDYQAVKIDSENKNKFIEDFINIVRDNCSEINVLSPQQFKKNEKYKIEKQYNTIKVFPSETILAYTVFKLTEMSFYGDKIDFLDRCIIDLLNKGNTINNIEPIRDFNGWSWNVEITNTLNMYYNIIFQNLLILFGYDFISSNKNKSNIYNILNNQSNKRISKIKSNELIDSLAEIAVALYNNSSVDNHTECLNYKMKIQGEMALLSDRKQYIASVTKQNNEYIKEIEKIDKILSDYTLIRKEFTESVFNQNEKYICISDVVDKYEDRRETLMSQIDKNNNVISPKEYLELYGIYKRKVRIFDQIDENKNKINIQSKVIKFQQIFLDTIKKWLTTDISRTDVYNYLCRLRYYNYIPFEKYKQITMNKNIAEKYNETINVLMDLIIDNKIIDLGLKNKELNKEVLRFLFNNEIIQLNSIVIKIKYIEDRKIEVEYYDGDILEHKEVLNLPEDEEVVSKKVRKIKIF